MYNCFKTINDITADGFAVLCGSTLQIAVQITWNIFYGQSRHKLTLNKIVFIEKGIYLFLQKQHIPSGYYNQPEHITSNRSIPSHTIKYTAVLKSCTIFSGAEHAGMKIMHTGIDVIPIGIALIPIDFDPIPIDFALIPIGIALIQIYFDPIPIYFALIQIDIRPFSIGIVLIPV
nr:hypothetical protein [Candidatus Electrothrix aestuarii]